MELPRTRAEFENLDAPSKRQVKQQLLKRNLNTMCRAVNPEQIILFAQVLHVNDIEILMLSRQRNSSMTVMMDFFMKIQRSLDLNPAWWEILEDRVLFNTNRDAYYLMKPWERRREPDGGAAGDGGRNPLSGGGATPPGPVGAPGAHPPYPKGTPLAETKGLADCLGNLCRPGGRWRDLAEDMGLVHGDHQWVDRQAAQGHGQVPHLLLDRVIERLGDSATVDTLTQALGRLGREGQAVLTRMVDRRLIQRGDGAGSGAGGDEGSSHDAPSYSNGSPASRGRARHVETGREISGFEAQNIPVRPNSHPGVGSTWPAPSDPNLSNSLLPKKTPQPILSGIIPPSVPSPPPADPDHLALQRSRSEAQEKSPDSKLMQRTQSVPVRSQDVPASNKREELNTSTDSLTDNEREFNLAQPPEEEDKILNSQGPDPRGARPKTRPRSTDTGGNRDPDQENLVTDGPSLPDDLSPGGTFGPPVSNWTSQSPETQTSEARSATSDQLQEDREASDAGTPDFARGSSGSQEDVDKSRPTVHIVNNTIHHNNKTYINIHDPAAVQIGGKNKAYCAPARTPSDENNGNDNLAEGAGRQEDEVVLPTSTVVQDEQHPFLATAPAGVGEGFSHDQPLGETPLGQMASPGLEIRRLEQSLQPSPLDHDAHQTAVKQRQFEEEPGVEAEGEREREEEESEIGEPGDADEEEEGEEEEPIEVETENSNGVVDLRSGNQSGPLDDDQSLGTLRSDNSLDVFPRADNSLSLLAEGVPQATPEEGHSGSLEEQQPQQSTSIFTRVFSLVKNAYLSLE